MLASGVASALLPCLLLVCRALTLERAVLTPTQLLLLQLWLARYPGPAGGVGLEEFVARSPARLVRLDFITAAAAPAAPGASLLTPYTAVKWTEAKFRARYPAWPGWYAANQARLAAESPLLEFAPLPAVAAVAADEPAARARGLQAAP